MVRCRCKSTQKDAHACVSNCTVRLLVRVCFLRRTYSYSEPQLYSQNSSGSYFDTQGAAPQVSTVVTSHSLANNGSTNGGLAMGLTGGQIISSSGAYLIGSNAMDGSAPHTAAQTTRASPATVQQNPVIKSLSPAFSHC